MFRLTAVCPLLAAGRYKLKYVNWFLELLSTGAYKISFAFFNSCCYYLHLAGFQLFRLKLQLLVVLSVALISVVVVLLYHGNECVFGIRFAFAPAAIPAPGFAAVLAAPAVYDVDCFAFPRLCLAVSGTLCGQPDQQPVQQRAAIHSLISIFYTQLKISNSWRLGYVRFS